MSVYWLSCATGTPPCFFDQQELFEMASYSAFPYEERRRIQAIFRASGIERRAMWIPRSDYHLSQDPDDFHHRYVTGIRAIVPGIARQALLSAGLEARDIDFVVFASCTGYTCPGFSVELAHLLGVPENRPTANLLGMGCSALIPALERAHDRLAAHPGSRALVISAEICSATYWIDHELETAVGNSIFGDGAAAIILSSNEEDLKNPRGLRAGNASSHLARLRDFRTLRDGRYLGDMGFTQHGGRLRIRLDREVPEHVLPLVLKTLEGLELPAGSRVAFHPGGKKILDQLQEILNESSPLWREPLAWARSILREYGNMSSPSVAFVLQKSFEQRDIRRGGEPGALVVMGPGLSVEAVRLDWLK